MANYFVVKHSTTNLAALEALGISPSTLKVEVWGGSKNRGFKPESYRLDIEREPEFAVALAQVLAEKKAQRSATAKRVAAEVAEDKAAGIESKAARLRREKAEWDMEAESMGLLPDSRTFASFKANFLDYDAAVGIGKYTRERHENTNYDELLHQGWSKDEARDLCN